ncbi:tRNA1(Val) (adenine(37)-N6)-methyltransferase [Larkinella harenae]
MFQFKQFTIQQDRTAMKVCTDSCIFGAFADPGIGGRLLDIGTGTGLLALMAAQRNPTGQIDAVEIDANAFGQAVENVQQSPFASRIQVFHSSIQSFSAGQYDRIFSNPPFYSNHLRSPDPAVNRALHNAELPADDLLTSALRLLKPDGQLWVLLPPFEMEEFVKLARSAGFYVFHQLAMRHQDQKSVFRTISGFSFNRLDEPEKQELSIFNPDGKTYSDAFRQLLKGFYLIL